MINKAQLEEVMRLCSEVQTLAKKCHLDIVVEEATEREWKKTESMGDNRPMRWHVVKDAPAPPRAALKRRSMDLSRALAPLRDPNRRTTYHDG